MALTNKKIDSCYDHFYGNSPLMSRTIVKTPFKWEKGVGIRVVLDPGAACHVRGQYSGLVSASGI